MTNKNSKTQEQTKKTTTRFQVKCPECGELVWVDMETEPVATCACCGELVDGWSK